MTAQPEAAADPVNINGPWVVVCEGDADRAFVRALLEANNIDGFDTPFPQQSDQGGVDRFPNMLMSLAVHLDKLSGGGVLIIADSKNDENKSFKAVCRKIKEANKKGFLNYSVPATANAVVKPTGTIDNPAVAVLMLPGWGDVGALETLCFRALAKKSAKIRACVEVYIKCCGVDGWSDHEKMDKARLQAFIAGYNRDDPNKALKYALQKGLIPMQDECFGRIIQFLKELKGG